LQEGIHNGDRVLPARRYGCGGIFLAATEMAQPGDVLVVEKYRRMDASCIRDLTALEALAGGHYFLTP